MTFQRSSGVVLHPTSLPGPYGIGELGAAARHFIDWLARAGQSYWQVMPLGPTGYGDSPYQAFSAFAGNPYLIDLATLQEMGLLQESDFEAQPPFDPYKVDYGTQFVWRNQMLQRAYARFAFDQEQFASLRAEFEIFRTAEADWLDDYSLFMALKQAHGGLPWNAWEAGARDRHPDVLRQMREQLQSVTERVEFIQFLFFRQWQALREYAHERGIKIIGDIPIFVAMDSSDAWADRDQFFFDDQGQPTVVAGVPPDYFSATGQLWGNPLYHWDKMQQDGFTWWIKRFEGSLKLYDLIRIDHFRGFAAYWEVPAQAPNAIQGQWIPALGREMFTALREKLGKLPIIAEDLGVITPDVERLRDSFAFPGMAVLQFAFTNDPNGGFGKNEFLPSNLRVNQVVYTGTHDNDTSRGWWAQATAEEKANFLAYTGQLPTEQTIGRVLLHMAFESRAAIALTPLQDLLNLGSESRMNTPGTSGDHNWTWRLDPAALLPSLAAELRELTEQAGRLPAAAQAEGSRT